MKLFLFIIANVSSLLATLMAISMCLAGGANASPELIRALKASMIGFLILGVLGLIGSILMWRARMDYATTVAFAPTVIVIVAGILAYVKEW